MEYTKFAREPINNDSKDCCEYKEKVLLYSNYSY